MFATIGFLVSLLLTVVALVLTLVSGKTGHRRAHLARAIITVLLLGTTVVFALLLGEVRQFPAREMGIHKIFSRTGVFLVPPIVLTGALLWRRPTWRTAHRVCVLLFLLAVLGAASTGLWVLWLSTAK
ncbi:MAG: hypothetical protein KDC87_01245 [Planctomycetes bacterium]|nr:hypothetical protein [Planctomycetota bacterium]MCB9871883.1 hypothetical protein [Planctomycetota bacterium]